MVLLGKIHLEQKSCIKIGSFVMKKINLICFCILFFLSSCDFMPNGDSVTLDKDLPITVQPEDFDERDIEDEDDSDEKKEIENLKENENGNIKEDVKNNIEIPEQPNSQEREWTILMYMSADNNLEGAAIEDFLEMEKSKLNTKEVTVLVLLDRCPSYDSSNGNWNNTKLYRLKTGNEGESKEIISEEIECVELGLNSTNHNELDMSAYMSLARSVNFIYENYPANHYGVIFWGHGEGWRGFCYDLTSETRMSLIQMEKGLKAGLNGNKLDFIGFDSCFGAEMEVFYQIREYAKISFGVEGLLGINGMNYEDIFNLFSLKKEKSALNFVDSFMIQYKSSYEKYKKSAFSVVDLENIQALSDKFNDFCKTVSKYITSESIRDDVKNSLIYNTNQYFYEGVNSDVYIDVDSIVTEISKSSVKNDEIIRYKDLYFEARDKAIIDYWNSDGDVGCVGIYFSTLTEGNYLSVRHPSGYIKGYTSNQIDFVNDSDGYVPTVEKNHSLLDKIFY